MPNPTAASATVADASTADVADAMFAAAQRLDSRGRHFGNYRTRIETENRQRQQVEFDATYAAFFGGRQPSA